MAGYTTDDGSVLRICVVDDNVTNDNTSQGAYCGCLLWSAPAKSQPQEDRRVAYVAHRDVIDRHVFHRRAINSLERESAAVFKNAISDCYVLKATIRLGAEFDPARRTESAILIFEVALISAIQKCTFVVTTHLAISDRNVLSSACITKRKRTLRADAVVKGRVNTTIRDAHVFASINVDTIAICIDLQIVDREVANTGCEDGEQAPIQDRNVGADS